MAIGARCQSSKTYLERHFETFEDCDNDTLIKHALLALREAVSRFPARVGSQGAAHPSLVTSRFSSSPYDVSTACHQEPEYYYYRIRQDGRQRGALVLG